MIAVEVTVLPQCSLLAPVQHLPWSSVLQSSRRQYSELDQKQHVNINNQDCREYVSHKMHLVKKKKHQKEI